MFENVNIWDSRVKAWVTIDSQYEFKRYVEFLASLPREPWVWLKVTVCQRYDYGTGCHGYNVCIQEQYDDAKFVECYMAKVRA